MADFESGTPIGEVPEGEVSGIALTSKRKTDAERSVDDVLISSEGMQRIKFNVEDINLSTVNVGKNAGRYL